LLVLVLVDWVVPTGLPVASTGLFEVPAVGLPAVVDLLGAVSPEFLLVGLTGVAIVPAEWLLAGAEPAGVVCASAVRLSMPATTKTVKNVLLIIVN
jgi:hypothetical protein